MLRGWCDGVCCVVAVWRGSKNGEFRCSREWWRRAGLLAGPISWQRHTGTQLTHAQCDQPGLAWAGLARAGWAGLRKCRCWLVTAVELVATCLVRSPHTCTWPRPHSSHQANQSLGGSCELRTSISGLSNLRWSQMVSQELRKPLNQTIAPPSGVRLLNPHWADRAWLQSAYCSASPANSGSPGRHILCLDPAHPLLHLLILQLHLQAWETLRPANGTV